MNAPAAALAHTLAGLEAALVAALAPLADVAGREARALLDALGFAAAERITDPDRSVPPELAARALALAARRAAGEPLAYLTGRRGFWRFELEVTPAVLVPRPETETLVEAALACLDGRLAPHVADLGTGSGAIACALALERPDGWVLATDRCGAALTLARRNARALRLRNVRFARADWLAPLAAGRFDLVAANPPYIALDDPCLDADGVRCEPRGALIAGPDGLAALRAITIAAPRCLAPGGWLVLEHGAAHGAPVRALLEAAGFAQVRTIADLAGLDRITLGRRPCGESP
jgi:release factor glutamine methyltransferase